MKDFSFSPSKVDPSIRTIAWANWTIRFNHGKIIIKRGMTSFTSYSTTMWIAILCPTYFSKNCKDLKWDPTLGQTYCEFDGNQIISKIVGKVLSPSQPLVACSFSRGEVQHQIDQMFHPHQQGIWLKFQCHSQINYNTQGIKQQPMTFKLIHHTCTHHMIQINNDIFNNGPHLGLQDSLL